MRAVNNHDPEKWQATDQATFDAITPQMWEWIGHHSLKYSDYKTSTDEVDALEEGAGVACDE